MLVGEGRSRGVCGGIEGRRGFGDREGWVSGSGRCRSSDCEMLPRLSVIPAKEAVSSSARCSHRIMGILAGRHD